VWSYKWRDFHLADIQVIFGKMLKLCCWRERLFMEIQGQAVLR
jgi:hypothetical protein